MKRVFLSGVAAAIGVVALGFVSPLAAQSTDLPACDEATLWTIAETVETDPFGTLWLIYECEPDGWQLIGATYCGTDGGCSSN